jgi:hypothetical protein
MPIDAAHPEDANAKDKEKTPHCRLLAKSANNNQKKVGALPAFNAVGSPRWPQRVGG